MNVHDYLTKRLVELADMTDGEESMNPRSVRMLRLAVDTGTTIPHSIVLTPSGNCRATWSSNGDSLAVEFKPSGELGVVTRRDKKWHSGRYIIEEFKPMVIVNGFKKTVYGR